MANESVKKVAEHREKTRKDERRGDMVSEETGDTYKGGLFCLQRKESTVLWKKGSGRV